MTAPMAQPQQQSQAQNKDTAAARKRRRRAPAGGAADDCFSCSKKSLKCDRNRPYCSQCLEAGQDCSGYKTQLTWGVGVASRGKLRGLSLPIAKSAPVSGGAQKKSFQRSRSSSSSTGPQWNGQEMSPRRSNSQSEYDLTASPTEHHASVSPPPTSLYSCEYLTVSSPDNLSSSPAIQGHWDNLQFSGTMSIPENTDYRKMSTHHLAPLAMTPDPRLSPSVDSTSDGYLSPMAHSFPRVDEVTYIHSPSLMYDGCTNQNSPIARSPLPIVMMDQQPPTSCPSLVYAASDHSSSFPSHADSFEAQLSQKLMRECDNLSVPELDALSTSCSSAGPVWPSSSDQDIISPRSNGDSGHWPSVYEPCNVHVSSELIAKMPFFMDYYKNTMAPSMVFIDSLQNPYRDHILRLAVSSQSLQHAICALSACNLRMKRRLSLGQGTTRELSEKLMAEKANAADQALAEEHQHRNLAVSLLNQQLNDPAKATHDSVLATILLLCHYRMAESGIAKFHTQFAGVKKILAMRQAQHVAPSSETAWMEAIFTYFDTISATINDRETQLGGSMYGRIHDMPLLPAGAENLVGCERGLFRTISRLARLNILSQNRLSHGQQTEIPRQPISSFVRGSAVGGFGYNASSPRTPPTEGQPQSPFTLPLGHTYKSSLRQVHARQLLESYSASPSQRFDGNGFISKLDDDELLNTLVTSSNNFDDSRISFWQEWKEVRQALQSWEFDAMQLQAMLPSETTPSQLRDLGCLSEAFRYAALLYTERLANPGSPSSSANFQNLVSQVVYYATSLDLGSAAEKFLLWPLFVAGSECINDLQRNIVRTKCRDIMGRSGYMNNLAALEILETLWTEDGTGEKKSAGVGPAKLGPFHWAEYIGGRGGEVEWIMF
ncbi:hypothetical protein jhhlp_006617 [Lomentospora prolificans]|uniref:Zn(2)-C6 fungal-type domain-containing protein n=1 Tax=Lomentospora prolificans TaxID=41688 RepID=A0A2N3N6E3_9PEZI|nr:hypothetical protein jhhlp_006617 [Lomentospora prolificans]